MSQCSSKTTKSPVAQEIKRPKRALTAYNIFFQEERTRILLSRGAGTSGKGHGKISFAELAQIVSKRWKEADGTTKSYYNHRSEADKKRYIAEMEIWLQFHGGTAPKKSPTSKKGRRKTEAHYNQLLEEQLLLLRVTQEKFRQFDFSIWNRAWWPNQQDFTSMTVNGIPPVNRHDIPSQVPSSLPLYQRMSAPKHSENSLTAMLSVSLRGDNLLGSFEPAPFPYPHPSTDNVQSGSFGNRTQNIEASTGFVDEYILEDDAVEFFSTL